MSKSNINKSKPIRLSGPKPLSHSGRIAETVIQLTHVVALMIGDIYEQVGNTCNDMTNSPHSDCFSLDASD